MTKKVLIAENEWELRNLLKLILEKYDFDVMEAEDDQHANSLLASFKPDLLLLDLSMKGFEIVHKLRNNYATQNMPVVMLIDNKAVQESPIKEYVQDFLLKPFEEDKVLVVLKKIFGDIQKKSSKPRPFGSSLSDSEKTVVLSPVDLPTGISGFKIPESSSHESTVQIRFSGDLKSDVTGKLTIEPNDISGKPLIAADAEKTVVLSPKDLPVFGRDTSFQVYSNKEKDEEKTIMEGGPAQKAPEISAPSEKTMVLSPEEIFAITSKKPEPKPEIAPVFAPEPELEQPAAPVPEFMPESTVQISNFDKIFGHQKTSAEDIVPKIKTEEDKSPFSVPDDEDIPFIKFGEIPLKKEEPAQNVPVDIKSRDIKEEPVIQKATETTEQKSITKFYSISGVDFKDLLLILSGSTNIKHNTGQGKSILAVVYGSETNYQQLETIMAVFGAEMQVLTTDLPRFEDKIETLQSSGAVIFEINPENFRKL